MRYIVFLIVFLPFVCLGQHIDATLVKNHKEESNIYFLKIYNKSAKPIAIKLSMSFLKFSEQDTLQLIKVTQDNGNTEECIYRMDYSEGDSRSSEPNPYQLIIINPQTYLLCNVELADLGNSNFKRVSFSIPYLKDVSDKDYKEYADRNSINLTRINRLFLFESINVIQLMK